MIADSLLPFFEACRGAGGRALVVGGTVRDALLSTPGKDVDIEVHGLVLEEVLRLLRPMGSVSEVGRSFGVLKLRHGRAEVDVSLPRRDRREGTGHKGIRATADPFLGPEEAARRRDLTINAIAWDPLSDVFVDPFYGRTDLAHRTLRAVDRHTFGEDPLRALRVAQFAARFDFVVAPDLAELCAEMPLAELPAERIRGEVEKLLLKGKNLTHGWTLAWRAGMWAKVIPEWTAPPPGLDRVAKARVEDPDRRLALLYAAACEGLTEAETVQVLDRLRVHRVGRTPVRRIVLSLLRRRTTAEGPLEDTTIRRLAEEGDLDLLAALVGSPRLLERADRLGVAEGPLPVLLDGETLRLLGVTPGPEMGRVMAAIRELQLEGVVRDSVEARHEVTRMLETGGTP